MTRIQLKNLVNESPLHKNLSKHGRLIYRPHAPLRRALGGNSPALFGRLTTGEFTEFGLNGSTFDGQAITRKLAKSLAAGKLIAWGPVPSGQHNGKYPIYADGMIWIAEERGQTINVLVVSDIKGGSGDGTREGYIVTFKCKTTNTSTFDDSRGLRVETRNRFSANWDFLNGQTGLPPGKGKAGPSLNSLLDLGEEVLWVRYKRGTPAPATIYRGGHKVTSANGDVVFRKTEYLELPVVPYSSTAARNFGQSVESHLRAFVTTPMFFEILAMGFLSGVATVLAGATFNFPPVAAGFTIAAGILAMLTAVLTLTHFVLTTYVFPLVGYGAELAYDWYYPPSAASPPVSSPPAGLNSILDNQQAIEDAGYGQNEIWEAMDDLLNPGDTQPDLSWPPRREPGNPPPHPEPWPWPTPQPDPDPDDGDDGDDNGPIVSALSPGNRPSLIVLIPAIETHKKT
jgi:hypothetical protein